MISTGRIDEDRFSRLRLIPWWNQEKIASTRVLVIGAGALGNEILKNLALLGFREVVVVDMDHIERSNLSRTVLFREEQIGQGKAQAAAGAFRELAAEASPVALNANVARDCGLGLFGWSDLILAGLDNREARLWINAAAWKMNRPWIDGAIEGINGVARVFLPGQAPCYECTLGETDWRELNRRLSCNLLRHEAVTEGKVPTTPTISSIIAGVQVQEGVKLLHGMPVLASRAFVFEGLNHTSYVVDYTENPNCSSHYTFDSIVDMTERSADLTLEALRLRAAQDLGDPNAIVEFSREVIAFLVCPSCQRREEVFAPVGAVTYSEGRCPHDGNPRTVETAHNYAPGQGIGSRRLNQLGLPLFDVFVGRAGAQEIAYRIDGDREDVLGALGKPR
jgi:adenylyltransferase/sulfurtransferase